MTTPLPTSAEPLSDAVAIVAPSEQFPEEATSTDESTLSGEESASAELEPIPPDPPAPEPPPVDLAAARRSVLDRIERSQRLPPGMRSHLREALKDCPLAVQGDEQLLSAATLLDALESWAPAVLGLDPDALRRPAHPGGETFFSGDPRQVSDEQAEQIARRQLERGGYLPATA